MNESVNNAELDRIFDALASRPRRQILAHLAVAPLTTSDISGRFSLSAPAVSRHLSVLESAGLVTSERRGQRVLYRIEGSNLAGALSAFAHEVYPEGKLPLPEAGGTKTPRESI
jgi:DNA-binding transcriptional ArsR family regulator